MDTWTKRRVEQQRENTEVSKKRTCYLRKISWNGYISCFRQHSRHNIFDFSIVPKKRISSIFDYMHATSGIPIMCMLIVAPSKSGSVTDLVRRRCRGSRSTPV